MRVSEIGHNSVAGAELKSFVERIERLQEDKQSIADDIKDVFGEAKGRGYDRKVLTEMLRLRKMDETARQEWEHLRDTYGHALGIFG
jgi:uncharacterized protein (UPF0335 family)